MTTSETHTAEGTPYTLAMWRVTPGREAEFLAAWMELAEVFSALPNPPIEGTLLQSTTDPQIYYSFGPWRAPEAVGEMRADPAAQAAIQRILALCDEATPGAYKLVAHVVV